MEDRKYPNSGALFSSKTKKKPSHPDYYGSFTLDMRTVKVEDNMVTFKLSGWKKIAKTGSTFLSLQVDNYEAKPKEEENDPFQ